jgi:hypothetical protein
VEDVLVVKEAVATGDGQERQQVTIRHMSVMAEIIHDGAAMATMVVIVMGCRGGLGGSGV